MSQYNVIDGLTGELVGGYANGPAYSSNAGYIANSSGVNQGSTQVVQTNHYSNSNYQQPATYTTTTIQQPGTTSYINSQAVHGSSTSPVMQTIGVQQGFGVGSSNAQNLQPKVVNTVVNMGKDVIKGQSRIQYVPFEKKVIEYKDQSKVSRVPKTRKVTEYKQRKVYDEVPRQVTVTDYYAVQYLRQYIPQYIPEKSIEYVPVERKVKTTQYIPVQRQIVHYPEDSLQTDVVPSNAQYHTQTNYVPASHTQTNYVPASNTQTNYVPTQTNYVHTTDYVPASNTNYVPASNTQTNYVHTTDYVPASNTNYVPSSTVQTRDVRYTTDYVPSSNVHSNYVPSSTVETRDVKYTTNVTTNQNAYSNVVPETANYIESRYVPSSQANETYVSPSYQPKYTDRTNISSEPKYTETRNYTTERRTIEEGRTGGKGVLPDYQSSTAIQPRQSESYSYTNSKYVPSGDKYTTENVTTKKTVITEEKVTTNDPIYSGQRQSYDSYRYSNDSAGRNTVYPGQGISSSGAGKTSGLDDATYRFSSKLADKTSGDNYEKSQNANSYDQYRYSSNSGKDHYEGFKDYSSLGEGGTYQPTGRETVNYSSNTVQRSY